MAMASKPHKAARKGSKKAARKAAPKKAPARKADAKAPARKPTIQKRPAPTRRPATPKQATRAEPSAMPEHAASTEAARRAVARPTKMHHEAQMEQAEHDHQDPRLAGIPGVSHEGRKVQPENFGQFKNKAAARLDKPINWFRRAAKPKQ